MADNADIARLRLIRTPQIGPVTYAQLIARFGDAARAIKALPELAARGGGRAPVVADRGVAERELAIVAKLGARYLFLGAPDYPTLLAQLDDAPAAIMVRGDTALMARPTVAMVGARNASAAACRFARGLAVELGREGVVIVSGLARGLDTAAHQGSLATGTIGVIASGIDIVRALRNHRCGVPRARAGAWRNDGGDLRARQRARPLHFTADAEQFDCGRYRQ